MLLAACTNQKSNTMEIKQGLRGHVRELIGNQMPGPDRKPAAPQGVATTLFVFEETRIDQVEAAENVAFYKKIHTPLVDSVRTDTSGFFQIALPVGTYSLFTKVEGLYYANSFDTANRIHPVVVKENEVLELQFLITNRAFF